MTNKFYVERRLHNGETDATDYAKPIQKDTLDEAKKEAHNILATYINYGKLDCVAVMVYDNVNNVLMSEVWQKPVEPQPEPTPEVTE